VCKKSYQEVLEHGDDEGECATKCTSEDIALSRYLDEEDVAAGCFKDCHLTKRQCRNLCDESHIEYDEDAKEPQCVSADPAGKYNADAWCKENADKPEDSCCICKKMETNPRKYGGK
jgi:hypothetical protein